MDYHVVTFPQHLRAMREQFRRLLLLRALRGLAGRAGDGRSCHGAEDRQHDVAMPIAAIAERGRRHYVRAMGGY